MPHNTDVIEICNPCYPPHPFDLGIFCYMDESGLDAKPITTIQNCTTPLVSFLVCISIHSIHTIDVSPDLSISADYGRIGVDIVLRLTHVLDLDMPTLIVVIEIHGGSTSNSNSYFSLADDKIDVFLLSIPNLLPLDPLIDVNCKDQLDHNDDQIDESLANALLCDANPMDLENI